MLKYLLVNQMTSSFVLYGKPLYIDSQDRKEMDETKCLWETGPNDMTPLIPDQAKDMKDKKFFVKVYEKHEVEIKDGVAVILTEI